MALTDVSEAAKAVVRRNTEEVQGGGDYALYDELFADDFVDHDILMVDRTGVVHLIEFENHIDYLAYTERS